MSDSTIVDVNTMYGITSLSELTRDDGAIINQIINVILIPVRTAKFRPKKGSSLHEFLGRPFNDITARAIRDSLYKDLVDSIKTAKIGIGDVQVIANYRIIGYSLKITYTSLLSGTRNGVSLNIPLGDT